MTDQEGGSSELRSTQPDSSESPQPTQTAGEPSRPIDKALAFSRTRQGRMVLGGGVLVLLLLVYFVVWPKNHTIEGKVVLLGSITDMTGEDKGDACHGLGGYTDMTAGADVTVKDGHGDLLATGELSGGRISESIDTLSSCEFTFEVKVPDADFYSIEVSSRGEVDFSKKDLASNDWTAELSLGSFTD